MKIKKEAIRLLLVAGLSVCLALAPFGHVLAQTLEASATDGSADAQVGKLGIGFHSHFPMSGISVKYWMPTGTGWQGIFARFGFSFPTEEASGSLTMLGGRIPHTIQRKPRVRFYVGAGANYTDARAKVEEDEETASGLGLEGVGGVEYTFRDLPNLGLGFEFGISFLRLSPENSDEKLNLHFTTSGTVGIHYYFHEF